MLILLNRKKVPIEPAAWQKHNGSQLKLNTTNSLKETSNKQNIVSKKDAPAKDIRKESPQNRGKKQNHARCNVQRYENEIP